MYGISANWRRLSPVTRILATAIIGLLLGLAVLMGFIWTQFESRYIFFPTRELESDPSIAALAYEEVAFATENQQMLQGWFIPGTSEGNGITWLWLHGNGGNISHRVDELGEIHRRLGVNILIFDYQGYGHSEGRPTEEGTYQDAKAAVEYLADRPDVDSGKIVFFGRSLGSAVALNLATEMPPLGLVLVSPFTSVEDMARLAYPFLPVGWLTRGRYDSVSRIRSIKQPVLIIHGLLDDLVPVAQGLKLFDAANEPKRFQVLPEAAHNDTQSKGGAEYWDSLERFMADLAKGDFPSD